MDKVTFYSNNIYLHYQIQRKTYQVYSKLFQIHENTYRNKLNKMKFYNILTNLHPHSKSKNQNRTHLSRKWRENNAEFDTSEICIEREQIYENPRKGVQRSRNGASFEEDPRHPRQRGGNSLPCGAESSGKGPIYIYQTSKTKASDKQRTVMCLPQGWRSRGKWGLLRGRDLRRERGRVGEEGERGLREREEWDIWGGF